ncbi:MAG TPA: hypothetical protein VK032_01055 [Burkholderiaceae bacterium]|nr:hypothetical protein [Burkholderiaceae bacterium]
MSKKRWLNYLLVFISLHIVLLLGLNPSLTLAATPESLQNWHVSGFQWENTDHHWVFGAPLDIRTFRSRQNISESAQTLLKHYPVFQSVLTLPGKIILSGVQSRRHWMAEIEAKADGSIGRVSVLRFDRPTAGIFAPGQASSSQLASPHLSQAASLSPESSGSGQSLSHFSHSDSSPSDSSPSGPSQSSLSLPHPSRSAPELLQSSAAYFARSIFGQKLNRQSNSSRMLANKTLPWLETVGQLRFRHQSQAGNSYLTHEVYSFSQPQKQVEKFVHARLLSTGWRPQPALVQFGLSSWRSGSRQLALSFRTLPVSNPVSGYQTALFVHHF